MLENLHYILQHNCGLDQQRPIIVGVSGGVDSLFLMDILWRAHYPLVIVHINHQIRSDADRDELLTRQAVEGRGLEFRVKQIDVPGYVREQRMAIEEAARILRYKLLFAEAVDCGAQAVAVGHNADDQVETVIMHLLRGTGTAGLRGMSYHTLPNAWSDQVPLVRPLLGVWRKEIDEYMNQQGYVAANDETNLDRKFLRNRIRHELIPQLESYNPSICQAIVRMAEVLHGDYEIISQAVESMWQTVVKEQKAKYLCLDKESFRKQPRSLQRQLIRRAVAHLKPDLKDVNYETIERALMFLEQQKSGQVDLVGGLSILVAGNWLWLVRSTADLPISAWPQLEPGQEILLDVPGEYRLSSRWIIKAARANQSFQFHEKEADTAFSAWFDGERLKIPLLVRGRLPGDRFEPMGMGGHRIKLSDYMINEKIPKMARQNWPLVVSGKDIIWIPGYRIAEGYQANSATSYPVFIELLPQT